MTDRAAARRWAETYLDRGDFEEELARLVAVPSESQTADGLVDCRRYLTEMMIPAYLALGFECRAFENPVKSAGPVLLATRTEGDGLPTVLGYGHGDVIHGQERCWSEDGSPWRLRRDDDRLYGRGSADNKSQHLINLRATEAVLTCRGRLGFNARVLIETGEEIGSPGLREIIGDNRADFAADALIASDGPRVRADQPTVSLGSRGALNFDMICAFRDGAHHSGNWGGALADPAAVLAHAIACVVSPTGRIQVPEWRPTPVRPLVRGLLADIKLDGGADGPDADPDWGEPGLSPAENVYAWNSFAVLAMSAGNPQNPVNAIVPSARAHCQLRYIAGTNAADILPALRRHLVAHGLGDRVDIRAADDAGAFAASRTEPDTAWAVWVCESLARSNGQVPAVLPQMGGSICNELFTDLLGIPAIWVPHSYPGCAQHAPDEHVLLATCRSALSLMAGLYWDLGDPATLAECGLEFG